MVFNKNYVKTCSRKVPRDLRLGIPRPLSTTWLKSYFLSPNSDDKNQSLRTRFNQTF